MSLMLGKLPEPWWTSTWEARKLFFEDDADSDGRVEICTELPQSNTAYGGVSIETSVNQISEPRSIKDAILPGLFYENRYGPGGVRHAISQEETDLLSDLLMKIFRYFRTILWNGSRLAM